jgi:hypothetical protein
MKRLLVCTGLLIAATTLLAQQPAAQGPAQEPGGHRVGHHRRQSHHHRLQLARGQRPRRPHLHQGWPHRQRSPLPGLARRRQCRHQAAHRCRPRPSVTGRSQGRLHPLCRHLRSRQLGPHCQQADSASGACRIRRRPGPGPVKMKMSKAARPGGEPEVHAHSDLGGTTGKLTLEWENHSASVLIAVH